MQVDPESNKENDKGSNKEQEEVEFEIMFFYRFVLGYFTKAK